MVREWDRLDKKFKNIDNKTSNIEKEDTNKEDKNNKIKNLLFLVYLLLIIVEGA